jgi:predicted metal-dependent HD superfamily phosphohydrolase
MTESQSTLLSNTRTFVTNLFQNKVNKSITFHNLEHTQGVVLACEEMANYYQFNDEDRLSIYIAAWFHDTGFSSGKAHGHEDVSIHLVTTFLQENKADPAFIQKVVSCIEATKMPQSPKNLNEQVLCDADLFHLGTDEFTLKNKLLRDELTGFSKQDISKKQWRKINISFLENHTYFTDYGRRNLQPVKEKNLEELKEHEGDGKKKKKDKSSETILGDFSEQVKKDTEKKKGVVEKTEREATAVFRIMASNQANLSHMADNKAHIMISVNSIILSIVISVLGKQLEEHTNLIIPTIVLVMVCVGAIVFSILATRPNVTTGKFTREDIQNKKTNLLFFGNFFKMSLTDYDWAMQEMLNDKQYLYSSMIKDNYFLGVVLAKKYRFLRISYNIFMYGIIISMLAFALFFILPEPGVSYMPG